MLSNILVGLTFLVVGSAAFLYAVALQGFDSSPAGAGVQAFAFAAIAGSLAATVTWAILKAIFP